MKIIGIILMLMVTGTILLPAAAQLPEGFTHRPVFEHFTSLSCPPCMSTSEPAATKLWEENGYLPSRPYNYIVFHEPNGGAGDDPLQSDESIERMRFYQPGVSGTPDHEWDGGYIEQGGVKGTVSTNYEQTKKAFEDSGKRKVPPVKLEVKSVFTGDGFAVSVNLTYLGTGILPVPIPVLPNEFSGHLYVFMVEDNVTAYSSEKGEEVLCHNAFRGYAIKDKIVTLEYNKTITVAGNWKIPTSPPPGALDTWIPVKPFNVSAVAVIYDDDDTTSQRGADGNVQAVPRAVNSINEFGTAYDLKNSLPVIGKPTRTYVKDGANITVPLNDPDGKGIASAYIFYNVGDEEEPVWEWKEMKITGECEGDVCGIGGTNTTASAVIPKDASDMYVLAYDAELFSSKAKLTEFIPAEKEKAPPESTKTPGFEIQLLIISCILSILFLRRRR